MQGANHTDHGLAASLLRPPCAGRFNKCGKPRLTSSRVPRQGSSPASFHLETASPAKRRSKGLSCVQGNLHAQFLEGWAPAMVPGYSIRKSGIGTARRRCICQHKVAFTACVFFIWCVPNFLAGLEPGEGKLSRPVLRGLGSREAARPLDNNPKVRVADKPLGER
jgi:hypothetical protein